MADARVEEALARGMADYTGLSAMELQGLGLRFEPCLCGHPQCAGARAELGIRFHAVGQQLMKLEPTRNVGDVVKLVPQP